MEPIYLNGYHVATGGRGLKLPIEVFVCYMLISNFWNVYIPNIGIREKGFDITCNGTFRSTDQRFSVKVEFLKNLEFGKSL